ncbi:MAG TPA: ISAzo13 family transposase [Bryobacteraceae bacterium]|nr:ISAzo13 family transposase [Bryobacteraceae bacterium]
MQDAKVEARIRRKFRLVAVELDERRRRQWAAAEARDVGWGGISLVARATGLSRPTIMAGLKELEHSAKSRSVASARIRAAGGGRRKLTQSDPGLLEALERLIDPATRGDPMSPLRWTCKSTAKLAEELTQQNHPVSDRTVAVLLKQSGYSLQANRKMREGSSHPDRNAQFEYINRQVAAFQKQQQPVISVDTKKKELVGEFKNPGEEWHPKGQPKEVNVHDFPDKKMGKAIPYGVYDLACNEGWVSVGIDHDTAEFACASIHRWWDEMGSTRFPRATNLLITADGGGSNSSRNRLWKKSLQGLADELGIALTVCHFPPGTSKWNKIEHRLFCFITKNWRGRPLTSYEVIVNLIANTTTKTGLTVRAALDHRQYETGIEVSDDELEHLNITRAKFHGEWNYSIKPRS